MVFQKLGFFHSQASSRQPATIKIQQVSGWFHNPVWSLRFFHFSSVTKNYKQNSRKKSYEVPWAVALCSSVAGESRRGSASWECAAAGGEGEFPGAPRSTDSAAGLGWDIHLELQPGKGSLPPLFVSWRDHVLRLRLTFATTSPAFLNSSHFSWKLSTTASFQSLGFCGR